MSVPEIENPFSTETFLRACIEYDGEKEGINGNTGPSDFSYPAIEGERKGPFRFLNFQVRDFADYTDFASHGSSVGQIGEVLDVFKHSARYDLLICPKIPEESGTCGIIGKRAEEIGLVVKTSPFGVAPFLRLDGDFESFCRTKSKRFRQKNRWYEKQLSKFGKVEYLHFNHSDQLDEKLEWAYKIYESRWECKYTSSKFIGKERDFYLQAGKSMADKGLFDLSFLMVGNTPAAFCYAFIFKGTFFYYITAVADIPDFKPFSPGTLLLTHLIKQAYEKKIQYFDFMLGNEGYKDRWTKEHRNISTIVIVKPSIKSRLAFEFFKTGREARNLLASSVRVRNVLDSLTLFRKQWL